MNIQALYEHKALRYCEHHGITDYKVIGKILVFYANYPAYLKEKRKTYKVMVNLSDMKENRRLLKRWNRKGNGNMYM